MKTAADILQSKPPVFNFTGANCKVSEALNLLSSMNCTFLVVMEGDEFQGVFSEHDFIRNVAIPGWDAEVCAVKDVMQHSMPAASPDTTVEELVAIFDSHHTRFLPVFNGHQFMGIITIYDTLHLLMQDRETLKELLQGHGTKAISKMVG